MEDCHFEKNKIGMSLGDRVDVEMRGTTFIENGIGIIAGDLDKKFLHILQSATGLERFKFAEEIRDISKVEETCDRAELISRSTLGQKLTNIANVATVTKWLSDIIQGVSTIELDKLIEAVMGG